MPLEHLQFFSVFEADNVFRRDRLFDRNGGLEISQRFSMCLRLNIGFQRLINVADQGWQVGRMNGVFRDIG